MTKKLKRVQSKIKHEVAMHKSMARDSANRMMFNKDPIVYANPHPAE